MVKTLVPIPSELAFLLKETIGPTKSREPDCTTPGNSGGNGKSVNSAFTVQGTCNFKIAVDL